MQLHSILVRGVRFRRDGGGEAAGHLYRTAGVVASMIGLFLLIAAAADAPAAFNPRAVELIERDWVLMQWAKRQFDANRDGIISVQ